MKQTIKELKALLITINCGEIHSSEGPIVGYWAGLKNPWRKSAWVQIPFFAAAITFEIRQDFKSGLNQTKQSLKPYKYYYLSGIKFHKAVRQRLLRFQKRILSSSPKNELYLWSHSLVVRHKILTLGAWVQPPVRP